MLLRELAEAGLKTPRRSLDFDLKKRKNQCEPTVSARPGHREKGGRNLALAKPS